MKKSKCFLFGFLFLAGLSVSMTSNGQASVDPDDDCMVFTFKPVLGEPGACAGSGSGCHEIHIIC